MSDNDIDDKTNNKTTLKQINKTYTLMHFIVLIRALSKKIHKRYCATQVYLFNKVSVLVT